MTHCAVRDVIHYKDQGKINQEVEAILTFHYCSSDKCKDVNKNKFLNLKNTGDFMAVRPATKIPRKQ